MSSDLVWCDGTLVPAAEATTSVFDHGLGLYTFRLFSPSGSERLHFTTSGLKK